MIIEINLKEDSKEYEALKGCLNRLKDRGTGVNFNVYKDKKAFTTDLDVEYVADDTLYDIQKEHDVELSDDEKDEIIDTVSYRIFNNYDYSEYNEYIADLIRKYAEQIIEEKKL